MDLETKARLISIGTIEIAEHVQFGPASDSTPTSTPIPADASAQASTSGPGAGGKSVFFRSGDRIVRLSVVEESSLRLSRLENGVEILHGDKKVAKGELVEPLLHCPEQAYITVSERCIYDCKFCAVPKLRGRVKPSALVKEMTDKAAATGKLRAISITSGVEVSPKRETERIAGIVRDLKARGIGVPIGVSVSPFPGINKILKNAGADEVKYNIETLDQDLFKRVCPGISYVDIMDALNEAAAVFGKNRVFSNVIVGLGESDRTLRCGIDELTEMGVLPIIRAVYPHPLRIGEIDMTRPSSERLLSLASYLRKSMDRNDLQGNLALTGCYRCTGCDLVPDRDL
ncbi:MAG: radical SAM protein [Methanotrichaceae archaeon]